MLISTIIAPEGPKPVAGPLPAKPKSLHLDELDQQLLEEIRAAGRYGTGIWTLASRIAAARAPTSRAEAQALRLEAVKRVRRLLRAQAVFMFGGKYITTFKFPPSTEPSSRRVF
jgi:hypothetical protein